MTNVEKIYAVRRQAYVEEGCGNYATISYHRTKEGAEKVAKKVSNERDLNCFVDEIDLRN